MAPASAPPPDIDRYFEESVEIWRLRLSAPRWLKDNPGLALTGGYVLASLIGIAYVFTFFRRFRINVLEFTEVTDFLVVVIREPATIALALSSIPLYWLYMRTTMPWMNRLRKRWPAMAGDPAKFQERLVMARRIAPYTQIAFIVVYAGLFLMLYSTWQASRVRAGSYPRVTVELKAETGISSQPITATLLGTTSRFLFVYRPETRRAEAIPFDAIARLSWDARTRRERERDASTAQ